MGTAPPFSEQLRAEMDRRKLSIRALGKLTDPDDPERGRRRVQRHLRGLQPTAASRATYARVLAAPHLAASEDNGEEDHPVTQLRRIGRELRRVERGLTRKGQTA